MMLVMARVRPDILSQIRLAGLPEPEPEVRFHPRRRWRWDLAFPRYLVAVERQGSTWTFGRHTRGKGYANDCVKSAEGQIMGWLVVAVTADMIRSGLALDLIRRALESRGWRQA